MSSPSHRISIYFSYILRPPLEGRARHSQECFIPSRGGFNLRCTRERDIPKNVFFLREKVLIYDAPSLPRKDNRFDQELPLVRGSKVWRKGSRPVAWLDDMVEIDSLFRRFRRKLIPSLACSGAFDETALRLIPRFPLGNRLWWSRSWFRWSSPPSVTKSQILRIYLDLRSIPLDLRSICPFVASKYCEATMHPVYLTKITVSTKNFPRSEGRKCGVKGLVQWRGLMIWSRSIACSGAFDEN